MQLKQFKDHIESFVSGHVFDYGISKPFSWRGSYDEVAFSITEDTMTKEEVLENINLAYTEIFHGYKGGEYQYSDYTDVNFEEEGSRNYSCGHYVAEMISKIEGKDPYESQEDRLIKIAFK
jgi:hypothetical protein